MTLEFAMKEAKRRTDVLGTTHAVIQSLLYPGDYMVLARIPISYTPIAIYQP